MSALLSAAAAFLLAMAGPRMLRRPPPCLYGLAVAAATVTAALAVLGLSDRRVTSILLAAASVAVLGLIVDVGSLPPATRVIVESVAAGGVVLCGVQVTLTGEWMDGPVSVMWIVGLTNAFALLGRVEGAVAPVAATSAAFLAGTALLLGHPAPAAALTALTGAFLGFLAYDRRRLADGRGGRRAGLGSPGSLFAGFVLACSAADLTGGRSTEAIAAGLLLTGFAAIVGAVAVCAAPYGMRRLGRARRRLVVRALAGAAAVTGAAGLAVTAGWMPPGGTAAGTAAAASAVLGGVLAGVRLRTAGRARAAEGPAARHTPPVGAGRG
ncbi:hypothetical protein [Microbispora sp. NPDC049125]|uniref:hypothetical protein n=1 Tax=Microbispora sp. NPDC049125 TaxID=3154929 RepID=UPI0034676F18